MELDLRSIKRFRAGSLIRFVLKGTPPGRDDIEEKELREIARWVTETLSETGNPAQAGQWIKSSEGWAGWLLGWRSMDDAEEWLARFGDSLSFADGRIIGGPRERSRQAVDVRPTLASFLYLTTSDMRLVDTNDRGPWWGVDDQTTTYVCQQMVDWVHQPRATEWVATHAEDSIEVDHLDFPDSLAEMVAVMRSLQVESALDGPLRYRTAQIWPHGKVGLRVVNPTSTWAERLEAVRELLMWSPPRSDYGYVRHVYGHEVVKDGGKSWPFVKESQVRYNRPLLASFVPDAFGIQLLTDAHLERANDLSDWEVRALGGGRHLVSAKEVERWFTPLSSGDPADGWVPTDTTLLPEAADLVDKARSDFGDMILTPEAIEAHSPWL